jgi:hypothetical protein
MSNSEDLGTVQVEDTTEKENIEPPTKKAKVEAKKLEDLETRLYDILSCNVCLSLPCKEIFQVKLNTGALYYIYILYE